MRIPTAELILALLISTKRVTAPPRLRYLRREGLRSSMTANSQRFAAFWEKRVTRRRRTIPKMEEKQIGSSKIWTQVKEDKKNRFESFILSGSQTDSYMDNQRVVSQSNTHSLMTVNQRKAY